MNWHRSHRSPAAIFSRFNHHLSNDRGRVGIGVRVLEEEDGLGIEAAGEKPFPGPYFHQNIGTMSTRLKYRMYFPFANCNLIYFTSNLSKFSPTNSNQRSVTTWSSVNEKDVTKALENFIFAAEDGTFSKKEMCNMYIEKLVISGNLPNAAYLLDYLYNKQINLDLITYNILLNAAAEMNSFDLFAEIFKKLLLSRVAPDFTSYVNAAMVFRKMSDSNQLLEFIRDVSEITIHREPTVMNRIIYITTNQDN